MVFFHFVKGRGLIHLSSWFFRETLDRGKKRGKIVSTGEEENVDAAFAVFTMLQSGNY